jgi:hypothetical protein
VNRLWDLPTRDVRPLLTAERSELLSLLGELSVDEWLTATAAPGWRVKDLALHLVDDDLGWLSRGRDGDTSGLLDPSDYLSFVAALAAKNQRWVDGAQGLSRPVVIELLGWTGAQMDAYYSTMDLSGSGGVIWADTDPVPIWFDIAQDLTERWVHQRQMRDATGRLIEPDPYLPEVLRTFAWAMPYQYQVDAAAGSQVMVSLGRGGTWTLIAAEDGRWSMTEGPAGNPSAWVALTEDAAWRLFTGAVVPEAAVDAGGDPRLVEPLMHVRGIIV